MTKIEQARALLAEHPGRLEFVAAAMKQLDMTKACANTYYQNLLESARIDALIASGWTPPPRSPLLGKSEWRPHPSLSRGHPARATYKPYEPTGLFGLSPAVGLLLYSAIF